MASKNSKTKILNMNTFLHASLIFLIPILSTLQLAYAAWVDYPKVGFEDKRTSPSGSLTYTFWPETDHDEKAPVHTIKFEYDLKSLDSGNPISGNTISL